MPHPVFEQFPPVKTVVAPGYGMDYLGSLTRASHMQQAGYSAGGEQTPGPLPVDEEYFEWADILESTLRAGPSYTMLELGAGYGRWAARAYGAARRRGCKSIHLGLVEAEPAHVAWIAEHLSDNKVPSSDYRIFDMALAASANDGWFYVAMPPGSANNSAKEWYGQALSNDPNQAVLQWEFGTKSADPKIAELENLIPADFRKYYVGHTLALLNGGWLAMRVKQTPLSALLRNYTFIDLIDTDIQGEELHVFAEAIDELNQRVACVHIGTHSEQCEARLREVFNGAGWKPVWDFACLKTHDTPFGSVHFSDGVQTWHNPRFAK